MALFIYVRETSRSSGCASADTMARLPACTPRAAPIGASQFHPALAAPSQPAPADILNQLATWLGESAQRHRVSVHAWLLANDRILLLATPADEEGLPRLMQTLGRNLAAPARRPRLRGPLPLRAARARRLGPALAGLAGNLSGAQRRVAGSRFLALVLGQQPYRQHQRAARAMAVGPRRLLGLRQYARSTARPTTASACRTACRARKPNASTRRCLASGRWAAPASSPAWPTPPAAGSRRDSADVRARNQPRPRQPGHS